MSKPAETIAAIDDMLHHLEGGVRHMDITRKRQAIMFRALALLRQHEVLALTLLDRNVRSVGHGGQQRR